LKHPSLIVSNLRLDMDANKVVIQAMIDAASLHSTNLAILGARLGTIWLCEAGLARDGVPENAAVRDNAAIYGNLEVLKWVHNRSYPWNEEVCCEAAYSGRLDILKYLHENGCPWDEVTCYAAAHNGHLEILKYLRENRCPWKFGLSDLKSFNADITAYIIANC
jgi:Ankyrin repeats (many copies)